MSNCPSCQTDIGEDFGLVKCPGCGVVCNVDLEGNITIENDDLQDFEIPSLDDDASTEESGSGLYVVPQDTNDDLGSGDDLSSETDLNDLSNLSYGSEEVTGEVQLGDYASELESSEEPDGFLSEDDQGAGYGEDLSDSYAAATDEASADDGAYGELNYGLGEGDENSSLDASTENLEEGYESLEDEDMSLMEEDSAMMGEEALEEDSSMEATEDDDDGGGAGAGAGDNDISSEPLSPSSPMSVDDFLSEIEVFGSLDSEPFQNADFFFDITVSGIDTKDIRTEVLETLSNSKLRLEEEDLARRIVKGQLHLHQIPAVKAAVIIQNLAHLSCELDWELKEAQDLGLEEPLMDEGGYQEEDALVAQPEDSDSFDDLIEEYTEDDDASIEDAEESSDY